MTLKDKLINQSRDLNTSRTNNLRQIFLAKDMFTLRERAVALKILQGLNPNGNFYQVGRFD